MKTALIRMLTIATLATSISAFAATSQPNHDAASNTSSRQQTGCGDNASQEKKQKKTKKTQQDDQNEKDFNHLLMGIYG